MTMLHLAWRTLVAAMLLWAAATKMIDPTGITRVLWWDGVPFRLLHTAVWSVVLTEVVFAAVLLSVHRRISIVMTLALFAAYTTQLFVLARSSAAPSCGCMKSIVDSGTSRRHENVAGIVRNSVVLMTGATILWMEKRKLVVGKPIRGPLAHSAG
jgi:hypothetical protein